ncbi:MAG: RNA polymerase sigma factor [Cellulophaga sp.]
MSKPTDEELMQSVSKGNLDAMTFIFERHHRHIYNFFFQMVRDADVCEDLTQNVFYKVIKYKHSYKGGKFVSWIFKIARNIFSDYYQKQKKTIPFETIENVTEYENEESSNQKEELMHLSVVLDGLSIEDKELVVMNKIRGIKYEQIAEITGSTSGAVKTKVHRIIKKIRTNYFETI